MQTALQRALGRRGIGVFGCTDGRLALAQWTAVQPDVVVLDLSLPGLDGLQVLAQARRQELATPVLILTARGTVGDRIIGLNTGADDYLPKPFDLDEMEARVRALIRRRPKLGSELGSTAYLAGTLIVKPGHAVLKEKLFALVFPGEAEVQYEAVEVVAYRLRKKLTGTGCSLVTLRGLGYLLKVTV